MSFPIINVPKAITDVLTQPPNMEQAVWRYMSLAKFIWMISKKQLWFVSLRLLDDKFEGVVPGRVLGLARQRLEEAGLSYEDHVEELRKLRRQMFVSCWHLSDYESRAMWALYCGRRDGVVVKTTYARLRESVNGLPIGLVHYEDFNVYNSESYRPSSGAWLKRPMFASENEVRIGFQSGWIPGYRDQDGQDTDGCPIEWPVETTIQSVAVFPGADFSYIEAVMAVVEQFAPGLPEPVAWSALSSSPPY